MPLATSLPRRVFVVGVGMTKVNRAVGPPQVGISGLGVVSVGPAYPEGALGTPSPSSALALALGATEWRLG